MEVFCFGSLTTCNSLRWPLFNAFQRTDLLAAFEANCTFLRRNFRRPT
jgi:hypothetical protein